MELVGKASVVGRGENNIEAIAAQWVIRLGDESLQPAERRELKHWLAENPVHAAAFDRARGIWQELATIAPGDLTDTTLVAEAASYGDHPAITAPGRYGATMRMVTAFVCVLLVAAGLSVFWFGDPLLMLEADYRTGPGEGRTVSLDDGSQIQLNSETALAIQFDGRERRVDLLAGEAYFTVAPMRGSETRPFVVASANGTAKALGTQFMVDRSGEGAEVVVTEHQVLVSAVPTDGMAGGGSEPVVLLPGQAVHYDRQAGIGRVTTPDLHQAMAWRRGSLIFDKVRLSDVVTELNRYRRGKIIIANTRLADRQVSGVFAIADLEDALASITRELGIQSTALPPFITVIY
jgi:transmembrane sensor